MLTYPAPGTKMSMLDDYATVPGGHRVEGREGEIE
jgi:hypothetical protein